MPATSSGAKVTPIPVCCRSWSSEPPQGGHSQDRTAGAQVVENFGRDNERLRNHQPEDMGLNHIFQAVEVRDGARCFQKRLEAVWLGQALTEAGGGSNNAELKILWRDLALRQQFRK
jgi:hypothetical protein